MELFIKAEHPDLIPERANPTDAGLDLKSKDDFHIGCNRILVGTGIRVKIPVGYVGLLIARSSLSKKGIFLTNSVGVIDSDYRGELLVSLAARPETVAPTIKRGERIAQLVIVPIALANVVISDQSEADWTDTSRGTGGFGSSGTH
jgi:dUTP pyrophosphatase